VTWDTVHNRLVNVSVCDHVALEADLNKVRGTIRLRLSTHKNLVALRSLRRAVRDEARDRAGAGTICRTRP